ncbi:aldehyde dehydrogenase family protein [Paraburkholderia sp. D1E]|uniref:aldehyde dehydrogenase family protein n=1 Tax=Paraburkholderia sp. D1E TaxID=3461398 RepID=UPI0040464F5A
MNQTLFNIVTPVDGSAYGLVTYETPSQVEARLSKAERAFAGWSRTPLAERLRITSAFVDALDRSRQQFAEQVLWLIGRPAHQADEIGRAVSMMRGLIETARTKLEDAPQISDQQVRRFVRRAPRGVVLAICAWNYPVAMACDMVITSMLAGNAVILKHAPQTAPIADLMEQAYRACGAPPGVFQSVQMDHPTAEKIIASGRIQFVQFIGSVGGGQAVHRAAARSLVPVGLELGGKDPAYVRADADIEKAAIELVSGSFDNAGQSCCSVERLYVHQAIYDRFVESLVEEMRALTFGDPREKPDVGPVVSHAAASRIQQYVEGAVSAGATSIGHSAYRLGTPDTAYIAPSALLGVTHSMPIMIDELFGPVLPIMRVEGDEMAIRLMNDSRYGLTASVWSADIDTALSIASEIDTGTCYINRCDHADDNLPWGGTKTSGIGRSHGLATFDELTSMKSFHVRTIS